MKTMTIPIEKQIMAILEGSIYKLLQEYAIDGIIDFRRYLDVRRGDIVTYLEANPSIAMRYFVANENNGMSSDGNCIIKCGAEYRVLWIDHGVIRNKKSFQSLNEAVAEHVLVEHGMY